MSSKPGAGQVHEDLKSQTVYPMTYETFVDVSTAMLAVSRPYWLGAAASTRRGYRRKRPRLVFEQEVRPRGVVVGDPSNDELIEIDEQALVEKLVPHPAVEGPDVAVLHRFAGRDVAPIDTGIPFAQPSLASKVNSLPLCWIPLSRPATHVDDRRQLARDALAVIEVSGLPPDIRA